MKQIHKLLSGVCVRVQFWMWYFLAGELKAPVFAINVDGFEEKLKLIFVDWDFFNFFVGREALKKNTLESA